jgi:tRNA-dihydrouridine synthase A
MILTKNIHRISIAPMLDITTHHYRQMMRYITKETTLWTEMIHHDTIIHSKCGSKKFLEFDLDQKPIVIQLGGNKIDLLEKAAKICKEVGYDDINLNCGCPSSRVAEGNFGACLMKTPELVAEITKKMSESSELEVTVKCRLGLNKFDADFLHNYIKTVSKEGNVNHFIMHARLAMMNLDTNKNRTIPPLQYDTVYQLKDEYPELEFSLNGGIKTLDECEEILKNRNVRGVMIGRAGYENPWMFSDVDRRIFNKPNPGFSRKEIVYKYADYCETQQSEGVHHSELIKPITFLFMGEYKNINFKNLLYSYKPEQGLLSDHLKTTIEEYEKINPEGVNKTPPSL